MIDFLQKKIEENGIKLDRAQLKQLIAYMEGILEIGQEINLTSIKDPEEFIMKHYVDSLVIGSLPEFKKAERIIDVGTGAGFPGIPLAIAFPEKSFVLADSLKKRLAVIDDLAINLGIDNVELVHGRAEDLGQNKNYREKADLCVSRAVADLRVLSEYCLPFVKKGGYFCSYKGPEVEGEVKAAGSAIKVLGGKVKSIEKIRTDDFEHSIILIKKEKPTPRKYPRRAGQPSKKPL